MTPSSPEGPQLRSDIEDAIVDACAGQDDGNGHTVYFLDGPRMPAELADVLMSVVQPRLDWLTAEVARQEQLRDGYKREYWALNDILTAVREKREAIQAERDRLRAQLDKAVVLPPNWADQLSWLFDVRQAETCGKVQRLIQMWQGLRDGTGDTEAEAAADELSSQGGDYLGSGLREQIAYRLWHLEIAPAGWTDEQIAATWTDLMDVDSTADEGKWGGWWAAAEAVLAVVGSELERSRADVLNAIAAELLEQCDDWDDEFGACATAVPDPACRIRAIVNRYVGDEVAAVAARSEATPECPNETDIETPEQRAREIGKRIAHEEPSAGAGRVTNRFLAALLKAGLIQADEGRPSGSRAAEPQPVGPTEPPASVAALAQPPGSHWKYLIRGTKSGWYFSNSLTPAAPVAEGSGWGWAFSRAELPLAQVVQVRDCHGDIWTWDSGVNEWTSPETQNCAWTYMARKWAPLTEVSASSPTTQEEGTDG